MERVLRKALVGYLELYNKLDPQQHGSRAGRSTLSWLLQHQDEILAALEEGANLDCIYLDFSKAYDKVHHGILFHKIKAIGISGRIGRWIMNFLLERRQQVLVNGSKSSTFFLNSGVPQGSVLGPMLFYCSLETYPKKCLQVLCKVQDEINTEDGVLELRKNLDKIYQWETENNMKFNGDKFHILRYGKNTDIKENTSYFTGNIEFIIEEVDGCRDLGVTMESSARVDLHI